MHGGEYRSRPGSLHARTEDPPDGGLTLAEIREQVRRLKRTKGFDITLDQRLAYLTAEVGEVAAETLKLSRDGNRDVGEMDAREREAVVEALGMEIYDVMWNLLDLAEMAGVDVEAAFRKKAYLNEGREW
jgi:NTP pyrophosphatase (non-canonical NTP hydrolase)